MKYADSKTGLWPLALAVLTLMASGALIADEPGLPPVPGVTINVASFNDSEPAACEGTDPVVCPSLRAAVVFANSNPTTEGIATIDTIVLEEGAYELTIFGEDETFQTAQGENPPVLTNAPDASIGDLDLTQPVVVQGAGSALTSIRWLGTENNRDRIFHVYHPTDDVDATLSGLTVGNGLLLLTPNLGEGPPSEFGDLPTTYEGLRHGGGVALGAAAVVAVNDPNKEGDVSAGMGGSQRPTDTGGDTGGTYTLTLDDVVIADSYSDGDGGGLFNSGDLTATRIALRDNASAKNGGGHYNEGNTIVSESIYTGNDAENGGAIFATGNPAATMEIRSTTVTANTAIGGAGIGARVVQIEIINSTFSGNIAADVGGGIHSNGGVRIFSSTIADNRSSGAEVAGGAGVNVFPSGGALTELHNSLLSNNTAGSGDEAPARPANCGCTGSQTNCVSGTRVIATLDFNLSNDDTCNFDQANDLENTDPMLQPLAENGGPTRTHALISIINGNAADSPAVDTGSTTDCPIVDQRGQLRPADGNHDDVFRCDIGAFELFVPLADLHMDGVTAPNKAHRDETFTIGAQIHNGNEDTNEAATNVVLAFTLPSQLSFVDGSFATATGTQGSCAADAGVVTCVVSTLGIDEAASASIQLQVTGIGQVTIAIETSAEAPNDPVPENNTASVAIRLLGRSDMSMTHGQPSSTEVYRGDTATASFTIVNNGADDATNVVFGLDSVGAQTLTATPDNGTTCAVQTDTILCELGDLATTDSAINVTVTATATSDADMQLNALVSADQLDTDTSNDQATASIEVIPSADIALTVESDRNYWRGEKAVVVTFTVENMGPSNATGVRLSGAIPAGVEVRSVLSDLGTCTEANGVITCDIGALAVAASANVLVEAVPIVSDVYTVSVSASADQYDPDTTNDSDTETFERRAHGGCAAQPGGGFDPLLPLLVVLGFTALAWRRFTSQAQA